MRELLDDLDRWRVAGTRVALARVVDVEGSGPRGPGAAMAAGVVSWESGPVIASMSRKAKPPYRKIVGVGATAMIVDSKPTLQGSPSNTASIRPPKPCITCWAVVALMRPDGFAEGAATGVPAVRKTSRACS